MARKIAQIWMAALTLILTASHSHAGLGWTLAQLKQQYGKPVLDQEQIAGRVGYAFTGGDYIIAAFFRNTQVSRILYICRGDSVFDLGRARVLLKANAPDATWDDASKNEADNSYRLNGTKDGLEKYYASLTDDGKMLAIWTQEDDAAETAKTRPDTPSVPGVSGSNEQSADGVNAGQVPNIGSELTPGLNRADVLKNLASPSPAQGPASPNPFRTKIARVKLRSSMSRRKIFPVANLGGKTGPTPSSPTPTPLLMNAGTALYNSNYTQPFKNLKKVPGP